MWVVGQMGWPMCQKFIFDKFYFEDILNYVAENKIILNIFNIYV